MRAREVSSAVTVDSQLRWLLELLKEHNVPYWLNSGTLLGMMREGKLLEQDQDIDLSLWAGHEVALRKLLPHFKKAGYRVLTADYRGLRFQYNFSLGSGEGRSIDINLFRRCGEYAWCPEYYFKIQPRRGDGGKGGKKRGGVSGAVRRALRFFWRRFIARFSLQLSITAWPWRLFVHRATWWIPATYFENLELNAAIGASIPADWQGYLEFRYGDWAVPRSDWVFHRDDGGLRDAAPEELVGLESSKGEDQGSLSPGGRGTG